MEKEIESILASIEKRDLSNIKSLDEIIYIRNKVLGDSLSDFIEYEKNKNKYSLFIKILQDNECEYASISAIKKNDIIYYLDYYIFYDIKLIKARVTSVHIDEEYINIKLEEDNYKKIKPDTIMFRMLTDEDKAKISLIELLNK